MKASFFTSNRQRLSAKIGPSVIILNAYDEVQKSGDMAQPFMQEANFWYLTGISEAGWRLVIDGSTSTLIAPTVDPVHRIFDGGLTVGEAKRMSGVDRVIAALEAPAFLTELAKRKKTVYTLGKDPHSKHSSFVLNPAQQTLTRALKKLFEEVKDCRVELAKLRAIKQPEEIKALRAAINLTIEAFKEVKDRLESFDHEYQVEAEFTHFFRSRGAQGHAYDPIVASGKNACTLHYTHNSAKLDKKDLLLLDIGARVDGYPADITRTYALGRPSKRQKEVHAAVEKAHRKIIALLKPNLRIEVYLKSVDEIMKSTLRDLGLLAAGNNYRVYFPHAISHGLGIDVHDSLGRPKELLPGMVLTVEPGIYIAKENIGVRIEDDILITKSGHENLSQELPTSL